MPSSTPDLIVVGASFAGAACAIAAAQRGLHVCVPERKRDPGEKLRTTGIIVKEAAEHTLLGRVPATMTRRIEQVRLYAPSLRQVALAEPDALHCFISKRYAPGYIGSVAQNPTGIQAGLALHHDPRRARVPDIDGFLLRVGVAAGLPRLLRPGHTRAGLIPCSGPVFDLARDRAVLVGDAAGVVSPVTAGGIHSAWEHGWTVGCAIAAYLRDGGAPQESTGGHLHARSSDSGHMHDRFGGRDRAHARTARYAPTPEQAAIKAVPRFRFKRALRWAYDRMQFDWPFDLPLHSPPPRWAAEQVYFHRRGI